VNFLSGNYYFAAFDKIFFGKKDSLLQSSINLVTGAVPDHLTFATLILP